MDAKELEALDPLHNSSIDVDGDMLSPLSPIVHDQLLGLTDIEGEVVVLAPHCRVSDLLPAAKLDQEVQERAKQVVLLPTLTTWGQPVMK